MKLHEFNDDDLDKVNDELSELADEEYDKQFEEQFGRILESIKKSKRLLEAHKKEVDSVNREMVIQKDEINNLIISLNTANDINEFIDMM